MLTAFLSIANISNGQNPNIIVIVADDLGSADVGFNGSTEVLTPNLDALALDGAIFSDGYVTASESGPSRAGILTGRYQNRFGFENSPEPTDTQLAGANPAGIPLTQKTMGEYMKVLGYNTKAIGKWYVGGETTTPGTYNSEYSPLERGFDEFFGFLGATSSYYPTAAQQTILDGENFISSDLNEYLTDAIAREAVEFIEAKKNDEDPFFIYMAFNGIQAPLEAKPADEALFPGVTDANRKKMLAMLYSMDENIGKVVAKLEAEGLTDNTIIVFISDNGASVDNHSLNTPYKDGKSSLSEGGIRVPFIMKWNNHIDNNITYGYQVLGIDILPTLITAAGGTIAPADKIEGTNLIPYLNCQVNGRPHDYLFWRRYIGVENPEAQWGVRDAEWKLVYNLEQDRAMLYNISVDPSETNDLYTSNPDVVTRLQDKYDEWNALNTIPLWGAGYDLDGRLSITDSNLQSIKVIPTVVLDEVRFESTEKILSVEVYNMLGQVKSQFSGNDIKTISLGELKAGNYILNIITNDSRETVKVIKE